MTENYLVNIPIKYYDYFADLYDRVPPVAIAVDTMVENVVGGGYHFEPAKDTDNTATDSEKILKMLEDVTDKLQLPKMSYVIVKDMLIFGNAFIEIIFDQTNKQIIELRRNDPRTIGIITDGKIVTAYAKVEQGKIIKCLLKENVMHVKNALPPLGKGWYGRSQIENLVPKIKEKFQIDDIPTV